MRVATYNLRYDSKSDKITVNESIKELPDPLQPPPPPGSPEQPWSTRRIRIANHLLGDGIQLAAFQEALKRQVSDMEELLGDDFAWVGVGRDDGKKKGEYAPIFYKKSTMNLVSTDTFWLSNKPFKPGSKYPGAANVRICTAARFELTNGGFGSQHLTVLNTHLDHVSEEQRKHAASMLLVRAKYETVVTGDPVLIMGDFNSPPEGRDSGAYKIITGAENPVPVPSDFADKYAIPDDDQPDFKMIDALGGTPRRNVSNNFFTFTGFTPPTNMLKWSRVDFILIDNKMGWAVDRYKVASAHADDGILESDHRPVFADIRIKSSEITKARL